MKIEFKSEYDLFDKLEEEKIISRYFCFPCRKDPSDCGHEGVPVESYTRYKYKCKLCGIEITEDTNAFGFLNLGADIKDHFYRHLDDSQKIKLIFER